MEKVENAIVLEGINSIERGISIISGIKSKSVQEDLQVIDSRLKFFVEVGIARDPAKGIKDFIESVELSDTQHLKMHEKGKGELLLHGVTLIRSGLMLIDYHSDAIEAGDWFHDSYTMLKNAIDTFIQINFIDEFERLPKIFKSSFEEILRQAS